MIIPQYAAILILINTMAGNERPAILELSIAFPAIAIAAVIFRFEARRIKRYKLQAEDGTIVVAPPILWIIR